MSAASMFRTTATVQLLCLSSALFAQGTHSDVRFRYAEDQIEIETSSGRDIGEGFFATTGFFQQFDANPGFASEVDVGMGINPGDTIVYNVLEGLYFWDGSAFAPVAEGVQIRIDNNVAPSTIVNAESGAQPGSSIAPQANFIDQGSSNGDFHSHVDFFLEPITASPGLPAFGAYGIKLSLTTDAAGIGDSDPFFIAFNFGLDGELFAEALVAFDELLLPRMPGDYDRDDDVDGGDFLEWQREFGGSVMPMGAGADGDGDGVVGAADYLVWRDHFGPPSSVSAISILEVPEPSAAVLAAIMIGGILIADHRVLRRSQDPRRR